MRWQDVRRSAARPGLSIIIVLTGALSLSPIAHAASDQLKPIVITPSSGCGLLTAYTAGTVWGPAPACGAGAFTLAFNQGNTPPTPLFRGVGTAGSALLAVPEGARTGYQITAPPGITIRNVDYDASQLQNIADGRGWIGFTYWNGGTAPVHTNGTAVDAAASGPLNTAYWGIELRCVQSACAWPGSIQINQIAVDATEAQGPSITPAADPGSLWNQAGPGRWIWNEPGNAWFLPVAGADSSGVCTLTLQVGTGAPIADPSLPPPNNSSWQECQPASWTATVDTREYVSGSGPLPLTLQATNAAGLPNAPTSQTLNVDNDPVSVSVSTPDDPNPTVWVNQPRGHGRRHPQHRSVRARAHGL